MENTNFIRSLKIAAFILVSFLLVAVISYCGGRKNRQDTEIQSVSKTDTVYFIDTTKHVSITNKFYHTDVNEAPERVIDTAEIIRNYYTKKCYKDTLLDSLVRVIIIDSIKQNNLFYRSKSYRLLKPYQKQITTTTTITITPPLKPAFYLGVFVGANSKVQGAGFEANLVTQKINYGLGYDIRNNAVIGKLLFKIKRK